MTLSYPIAFFVTGGLCVVGVCILFLVTLPNDRRNSVKLPRQIKVPTS